MKRTPLRRKTPLRNAVVHASAKRLRRSRPKMTPARRAACGQDCTLRLPGCRNERETVVLCHLRMFGGGGMGMKPDDTEAVFACRHCHDLLDGRARLIPELRGELNYEAIAWALVRTLRAQRAAGLLIYRTEDAG